MAQEYEVREEFRSHSLSQLMDDTVLCFQGVGDIQAELLKQYFAIAAVRDLANWSYFLWSLEIQELALHGGDLAHTPMRQIAQTANPAFKVRERALELTPEKLMLASVADLDGLTPAQDLALYDIFRITTIAQLAHNRIMLEARVIQYLEGQSRAVPGEATAAEGVDSVLGRPAGAAAQHAAEEIKANRDERLLAMESETRAHVQERLATLRERGRSRAPAAAGEQPAQAAAGAAGAPTAGRLESIRASRERGTMDTGRSLRRPGEAEARESRVEAARAASGVMASRAATTERAAGPTLSGRAASVLAARGAGAGAGAHMAGAEAGTGAPPRLGGAGGAGAAAARTGATARTTPATATGAAATNVPPEAAPPLSAASAPSRRAPPILLAGAAVLVVVVAILIYVLRSGTPPSTQTAPPGSVPGAPGAVAPPGTAVQMGAKPGAPGAAAPAGKAAGIAGTEAPSSGSGAPGVAKTIHTVREGQSLWRISKRYYQLGHDWPVIYKENQEQIDDPDLIYPKQQFRIPRQP